MWMRNTLLLLLAGSALVLASAFVVSGCEMPVETTQAAPELGMEVTASEVPTAEPASATPTQSETVPESVAFVAVVDGDTIQTTVGAVRLIGIDTPETAECGYEEASATIGNVLSAGDEVTLQLPEGQSDRDQHDRLIRYVITSDGSDLGLVQLQAGNAIARFDSTDGYPAHPQEGAYHAAQVASASPTGSVITSTCGEIPEEVIVPLADVVEGETEAPWWMQYSSCSRLKKNTVGHPKGPFRSDHPDEADMYDWFQYGTGYSGDGDGDGLACE